MRVGKYSSGAQEGDIDALKRAVFNLGIDATALISDSTTIEFLEAKHNAVS
jgi:phage gp29-like protein